MRIIPILLLAALALFSGCETSNTSAPQSSGDGLAAAFRSKSQRHRFLYLVEHIALPDIWFNSAAEFTNDAKARGRMAVVEVMTKLASKGHYEVSEDDLAAIDIDYHEWGESCPGWIVSFPQPRETSESSFAAMLFDGKNLRFYCLEFDDSMGETMWFLCGWAENAHLNFGTRPGHSKEDFIKYVGELLENNPSPGAMTIPGGN